MVTDYGQFGQILDLSTGRRTLTLDRGSYHNETTPFPVCFVHDGRRTVVVAATAWNRLDAFDPATGRLLTVRETERLDYFHGRLLASASGRWIADDGWVWSPVGAPTVIDAAAWLNGQTNAAEEGRTLAYRAYAWDQPMAWLDGTTVAIQRVGPDDEFMLDGVQLFDAATTQVTSAFAGPSGQMWPYLNKLYVSSDAGTEIWEPNSGTRVGFLEEFTPVAQNPTTGTLAELDNNVLRTWTPAPHM